MTAFVAIALGLSLAAAGAQPARITVAAAADLRFAMDELATAFERSNPGAHVDVVYGSSGKFHAQILEGAPYDLFFSADVSYPRELERKGFTSSPVTTYAFGRIVLWSPGEAALGGLAGLTRPEVKRIAIANPKHAPYGKRAKEAMRSLGLIDALDAKLVLGESVAQAAQFVQAGAADVGVIALSLALGPELRGKGRLVEIPQELYTPLEQAYVATARARGNALVARFATFVASDPARELLSRYGFTLPGGSVARK